MKSILCFVTLVPGLLWACPDFTGVYKNCKNLYEDSSRKFEVTLAQSKDGPNYQYVWGVVEGRPLTFKAVCKDNKLVTTISEGVYQISIEENNFVHRYFPAEKSSKPVVIQCDLKA